MDEVFKLVDAIENDYVKAWKKKGGKVLGYGCLGTPMEVIEAAGILPYRIRALGNSQTEIADAHLSRFNCSFCRSCLQLGLDGTYDFLDGLIESNGCDHLRGMFENWDYVKHVDFFHYVRVPHINNEDSFAYFVEEIGLFRKAIEEKFGVTITDKMLFDAIDQQDRVRDKLRALYALREQDRPAVMGSESMALFLAGTSMTSKDFVATLDRVLEARKDYQVPDFRARLMLIGSATDEIDFIKSIEEVGGMVVTDGLCYGYRAFWPHRPEQGDDPDVILAKLYLENLLCPRMFDDYHNRRRIVFDSVKRAKVDGVIAVHNKFCDVHGIDNVQLRMDLVKEGIPVLQLEKEYGSSADEGRMKTRVQAFLERIGDR